MKRFILSVFVLILVCCGTLPAADLYVGAKTVDITPDGPVLLAGQFYARVAKTVHSPIEANIIVLESREGDKVLDSAILVSADIVSIRPVFLVALKDKIQRAIPGFDISKLIVSATHTHASLTLSHSAAEETEDVIGHAELVRMVTDKITQGVKEAWDGRQKAKFSYGLGHAVIGYNRRAVYADGTAVMYGKTNTPNFRAVEGIEDHDINSMFFWDMQDQLIAMLVNVSCPSQEVEHLREVSSDFWGPTRDNLRGKHGGGLVILGCCGAAGDISPHLRYMEGATLRMDKLRNFNRLQEIGRRLSSAVEDTYEVVKNDKHEHPAVCHEARILTLPQRIPTKAEYELSKAEVKRLENSQGDGRLGWNRRIIGRYEDLANNPNPVHDTPVNVLRIGDAVLCTNQFELYTDFGIQIKARSKAVQTFVLQLTNGAAGLTLADIEGEKGKNIKSGYSGTYLPSERAKKGGGYGAVIQSNIVGPEGGQILVEETLKMIDKVFQ